MAVTLSNDLIGNIFGLVGVTPAGLDGLTDIVYDRVDDVYRINEGATSIKRQRTITFKYVPPGGSVWLDIYNAIGKKLLIVRKTTVAAVNRTTIYPTTIKEVLHHRYSSNLEEFTIICTIIGDDELGSLMAAYPLE